MLVPMLASYLWSIQLFGKRLTCNDKFCSLAILLLKWIKTDCLTLNISVINIQWCNNTDCHVVFLRGNVYTGEVEPSPLKFTISMGFRPRAINHPGWVSNDVAGEPHSGTRLGNLSIWSLENLYGNKNRSSCIIVEYYSGLSNGTQRG